MNDYSVKQIEGTAPGNTSIIRAGLGVGFGVGALVLATHLGGLQSAHGETFWLRQQSVKIEESSRTAGQHANPFTGEFEYASRSFEEVVATFYANLLGKQEPLEKDFEKVLYSNLRNLFIRT